MLNVEQRLRVCWKHTRVIRSEDIVPRHIVKGSGLSPQIADVRSQGGVILFLSLLLSKLDLI